MNVDLFAILDEELKLQKSQQAQTQEQEFNQYAPLASRMRPTSLDDYIGQNHIIAKGKPLYEALKQGQCFSMILWGPPGVGKTTLSLIVAKSSKAKLIQLSAVSAGIKDIKVAIDEAKYNLKQNIRTILFVDEVHRFNKAQQDAFLPYIEDGTITFIGATTENPSFELNNALLSRVVVYVLQKLSYDDLSSLLTLALTKDKILAKYQISIEDKAKDALIMLSDGDARHLLNNLDLIIDSNLKADGKLHIVLDMVKNSALQHVPKYDKGADMYYDLISAFHKSVRGSAPQAALYWYCRILQAGGDPLYVARRLLAIATEDIGLADPNAMSIAINAYDIYKRVGAAEGERAIALAAVYLALMPKSNKLYMAFNLAKEDAKNLPSYDVPLYLRNAPTKLMENLGYHEGYRYAHDYPNAYAAGECFMPKELQNKIYYEPSDRGLEQKLKDKMAFLKDLDAKSNNKRY